LLGHLVTIVKGEVKNGPDRSGRRTLLNSTDWSLFLGLRIGGGTIALREALMMNERTDDEETTDVA
jgi:hypothetical protein